MKKIIAAVITAALLVNMMAFVSAAADSTAPNMYTIQVVNMYNQPNASASIVQVVPAGSGVVIYDKVQNEFTNCYYNSKSGWIATEFLTENKNFMTGGGSQTELKGKYDVDMRLSQRTTVYTSQTTTSNPLGTLEALTEVHVNSVADGWANINYNSKKAYIPTCYIQGWNTPENYPKYSNTWYDGYDWSAVYDYAYHRANNPDVADMIGTDPEALIADFVTNGIEVGRRGNADFEPYSYMLRHPELFAQYGADFPVYYKDACGIPY